MPAGFQIVKDFESGKCVHLEDLKHMANHICGNLNNWSPIIDFGTTCILTCLKRTLSAIGDNLEVLVQ